MSIIDNNYKILETNYAFYIEEVNKIGDDFGGPSIYFHKRALEEKNVNFLSDLHVEYIYATLASWGMHRMGKTKTKMNDFEIFRSSILQQKDRLTHFKDVKIEEIGSNIDDIIEELKQICFSICTSASNSKIVGNSKTLAHILPDLIPPIDRQYTIRFFTNKPKCDDNIKSFVETFSNFKGIEEEKVYFSHILNKTFDFVNCIKKDANLKIDNRFNTSYPKIFDNFIIAYMKDKQELNNAKPSGHGA